MSGPLPFQEVKRFVSPDRVVELLGLPSARERRKHPCVWCASTDGLHRYADGFKCFSCGRSGDVIDVAAAAWNASSADACQMLADRFGIAPAPSYKPPPPPAPNPERSRDLEASRTRCEVYGDLPALLTLSDRARKYLYGRGLDPDYCAAYGFRSIGSREQFQAMEAALVTQHGRDAWDTAGLISWWNAYPLIVIPYWSATGMIVAVRARSLDPTPGRPKYLSPRSGASPIAFNIEALEGLHATDTSPERVFICEGELDTFLLHQLGEVAVGLPGATPSAALLEHLAHAVSKAHRVAVITDSDKAGDRCCDAVARALTRVNGPAWFSGRVERWTSPNGDVTATLLLAGPHAKENGADP